MFIDSGFGDLQLLCDLLVGEALLPAHPENLAPPGRQLVDRFLEKFLRLLVIQHHYRGIAGEGGHVRDDACQLIVGFPEQFPETGDGPVTGNHMQPRLKLGYRGQFGSIKPDAEENILCDILRLRCIFDVSADMCEYLQPVLIEQVGKCFRIIFGNTDQQFFRLICHV